MDTDISLSDQGLKNQFYPYRQLSHFLKLLFQVLPTQSQVVCCDSLKFVSHTSPQKDPENINIKEVYNIKPNISITLPIVVPDLHYMCTVIHN